MTRRVRRMVTLAAVLSGAVAGCGTTAESDPAPRADSGTQVSITNNAYDPSSVDIPPGGKVVWAFEDGQIPHTVTSDNNVFGSPPNGQTSGVFERVFPEPGTFAYHCDFHPDMTATVNVR